MVTSSEDSLCRLWDSQGKLLKAMKDHKDCVNVAKWNKECNIIASAGFDKKVKVSLNLDQQLWDKEGKILRTYNFSSKICLLDWKNNQEFATCDFENNITFWNVDSDKPERSLKGHESTITQMRFDPTGTFLATCSEDSLVKVIFS